MSQELVPRGELLPAIAKQKLATFWKTHHKQIMAVTAGGDVERLSRVTYSLLYRTPKLIECSPFSLLNGIVLGHQLGLVFGTAEVSLVPYGKEASLIIGYQGKAKLALQSGTVEGIEAEIVHTADRWEYWRDENGLHMKHEPAWADRGDVTEETVIGAYCQIGIKGGRAQTKFVSIGEILRARARSRGYNYQKQKGGTDNPWINDFGAMCLKTAVHRACKLVPQTPQMAKATAIDDADETSAGQLVIADGLDISAFTDAEIEEPTFTGSKDAQGDIVEQKTGIRPPYAATLSDLNKYVKSHRQLAMRVLGANGYETVAQIPTEDKAVEILREIREMANEQEPVAR